MKELHWPQVHTCTVNTLCTVLPVVKTNALHIRKEIYIYITETEQRVTSMEKRTLYGGGAYNLNGVIIYSASVVTVF